MKLSLLVIAGLLIALTAQPIAAARDGGGKKGGGKPARKQAKGVLGGGRGGDRPQAYRRAGTRSQTYVKGLPGQGIDPRRRGALRQG